MVSEVKLQQLTWGLVPDEDPDPSYLYQDALGFDGRRAAFERGEFGFVGVRAMAELWVAGTFQTVSSPGLWGIEDDSGDDYFKSVADVEVDVLIGILAGLGVDARGASVAREV